MRVVRQKPKPLSTLHANADSEYWIHAVNAAQILDGDTEAIKRRRAAEEEDC